jgi:ribosome biogenesis GTPase / thiamine phosphate phosphatase
MSKRRLSEQQQRRIKGKQKQLLHDENPEQGLVVARYARHVDVKPETAPERVVRCHVRTNIESITVGDYVAWLPEDDKGVVVAVHPRRSYIERPDGLGKLKPVAANIDQIFIVIAPEPEPHTVLLDRYLLAAELAGIQAHVLLNKIDFPEQAEIFDDLLRIYRDLGYQTLMVSCVKQLGLEQLRSMLVNQVSVFVGQSGVGKSSIVNALLPEVETKTSDLSDLVAKGRHTTTTSSLYDLPEGGYIIDSPGIREFHLHHINREQVFAGFRELQEVALQCQFRNCQHDQEPGCAVNEFIEAQKMHPVRLQSLDYILNQQDVLQ